MKLSEPDYELAVRLSRDVSSEHRLTGYRYRPRWGGLPANLYSFEEITRLLNDKSPRLPLAKLVHWLRRAVDDQELAAAVAEVMLSDSSDRERLLAVSALCNQRLTQCQRLLVESSEGV